MSKIYGVVTGEVEDLNDPEGEGRIRLRFAWLPGNNQSYWAPVATFMSGDRRGSWFMPELGDEVLVAFEHGDVNHPYVIGFLWNGQELPPIEDGATTEVRRLRTVSGHVIEFDDRGGQEHILIKTAGGHEIEMKDTPPASVTIKTNGGQQIKMDDTPAKVEIKTTMGNSVTISDAPPGIQISAPTGMLTANCMQANVTASALLNVTAPMTVFSGIVQMPTLIAQAVVGSAYTPAPGNTFGL